MPEYLSFRCCMCPNTREIERLAVCPAMGSIHPKEEPCRFVKAYIDKRGRKYRVMGGDGAFKAKYQIQEKNGDNGWRCLDTLPWRGSFDKAQADLNEYAKLKGWGEWDGSTP